MSNKAKIGHLTVQNNYIVSHKQVLIKGRFAGPFPDQELAMSPEECRSRARHYQILAEKCEDLAARRILSEIAAGWRRMAEPDHAGFAEPAKLPAKIRPATQDPRMVGDPPVLPASVRGSGSPAIAQADFPRSAGEPMKRKAAKVRQLATEVTTPNIRQRLLDIAMQYEQMAETCAVSPSHRLGGRDCSDKAGVGRMQSASRSKDKAERWPLRA